MAYKKDNGRTIMMRATKGRGASLKEIGFILGMTAEGTRLILVKALDKMKKNKNLKQYLDSIGVDLCRE